MSDHWILLEEFIDNNNLGSNIKNEDTITGMINHIIALPHNHQIYNDYLKFENMTSQCLVDVEFITKLKPCIGALRHALYIIPETTSTATVIKNYGKIRALDINIFVNRQYIIVSSKHKDHLLQIKLRFGGELLQNKYNEIDVISKHFHKKYYKCINLTKTTKISIVPKYNLKKRFRINLVKSKSINLKKHYVVLDKPKKSHVVKINLLYRLKKLIGLC